MLINELKRAFWNKGMLLSLLIGNGISIYYIVMLFVEKYDNNKRMLESGVELYKWMNLNTPFDIWLMGRISIQWTYLMYFMPILVALPYAVSYAREKKLGYLKNVTVRCDKKKYLTCKCIAVFMSGEFAVASVMLVNLMLCFTYMEYNKPTAAGETACVSASTMLGVLYYSHPFIYSFIYIFALFIFAGSLALVALLISEITVNPFTVALTPFLIMMIFNILLVEENGYYLPMHFLKISSGGYNLVLVPITFGVVVGITFLGFILHGGKKDVL